MPANLPLALLNPAILAPNCLHSSAGKVPNYDGLSESRHGIVMAFD